MKFGDIVVAVAVIAMVVIIIIPIPKVLLDILLTVNLALSLLILLLSMYTKDILDISVFPSLLLITTLYRMSLNISTTRGILTEGNAGSVIEVLEILLYRVI